MIKVIYGLVFLLKEYFSKIFQPYIIICKRRWEIDKKEAINKLRQQETGRKRANNLRGEVRVETERQDTDKKR
jgi:hypothetical protein